MTSLARAAAGVCLLGAAFGTFAGAAAPGQPAAAAAPQADYAIQLTRPAAVGQKRLVSGSVQTDDRTTGGPSGARPENQQQVSTLHFIVATEVQAVSARGNVQRAVLYVRRLTKESGGISAELAKPGEAITARLEGHERVVEMQGARVAPDLQDALAALVPLRADDEPTDDDLFGTATRRRVGESWPVHADAFARMSSGGVTFDPRQVAGTVTLAGVKVSHGLPCLEVRWRLEAQHGTFKAGTLPSNLTGTMTTLSVTGAALVPVDAALPAEGRDSTLAGIGDFTGINGGGDELTLHRVRRQVSHLDLSKVP